MVQIALMVAALNNLEVKTSDVQNAYLMAPLTEFRQPLQVRSHLEMSEILVQLGHIQCT